MLKIGKRHEINFISNFWIIICEAGAKNVEKKLMATMNWSENDIKPPKIEIFNYKVLQKTFPYTCRAQQSCTKPDDHPQSIANIFNNRQPKEYIIWNIEHSHNKHTRVNQ